MRGPVLRPLGFGDVLDETFRSYRRNFWLLAALALVPVVPTLLVQIVAGPADQFGFISTTLSNLGNPQALSAQELPQPPNLVLLLVSYLLTLVLVPLAIGLVPRAGVDLALGRPTGLRSAVVGTLRRYWGLLAVTLMYLAVALLAITCVALPVALWILVRWAVALPAMFAEGVGPTKALSRSWDLTRQSWWRIFGVLVVVFLLQIVGNLLTTVVALLFGIVVPFVPPVVRGAIGLTATTVGSALVAPLVSLCLVLLYFDVRVRRENFDLWQLADQASASATKR